MIERKSKTTYKCSHCSKWFELRDDTYFLKIYKYNGLAENVAVFCSLKCKDKFHTQMIPTANNIHFKQRHKLC